MKKFLVWSALALLVIGAVCFKPIKNAIEEKPVEKSISFAIYKGYNYKSKVYDSTSVQIHITVEKVTRRKRSVAWDKTFDAKMLKQYPSLEKAFMQKVIIPGMLEKREHLEVHYILIYNSQGNELQMQSSEVVLDSSGIMYISI